MFADQTTRAVQPSKDDKTVASIKKRAEAEAEIDFVAPRLEAAKNLHVETVPLPVCLLIHALPHRPHAHPNHLEITIA
jgi:hypothetical protein